LQRARYVVGALLLLVCSVAAQATIFGTVRGVVLDPQNRPIVGAQVVIHAARSDWTQSTSTDANGEFTFTPVTVGNYTLTVSQPGFETVRQGISVLSAGSSPVYRFSLPLATVQGAVTVRGQTPAANVQSVTPTTLVSRTAIEQTPGAALTNSMAMITDYVPGTYMVHDMLHMRGGHQVSWLIDGVPIPNTNIANNLGPAIDPQDIGYLSVMRGSYDAEYGDRTYGIFNLVPRTGFEMKNRAELVTTFGNFDQTDDYLSFGSHTRRSAYYVSLDGNRSNYGLETPIARVVHDAENGYGGFASFVFNRDPEDQFRLVASLRQDYYQIPYDPNPSSAGNQVYDTSQFRDGQHETDGYVAFTWVRTFSSSTLLTVSPFYHYNAASYQGAKTDYPVISDSDQAAHYGGMQATFAADVWKNDFQIGVYGFAQRQNNFFSNTFTDGSSNFPATSAAATGGLSSVFVNDKFEATSWLTLIGGLRESHFAADITENATDPRVGLAIKIPRLNWVFRGFYGDYYQPPPLLTATGPLLALANSQNLAFSPLHGERDEEHQFGVTIPYRGWTLDADTFQTRAKNWLDHSNIGESNLFWPLTWDGALIQGWELTLRSPRLWNRGQFHLAYSNQIAQARGPFTGGLVCPSANLASCEPPPGYSPVDHDQRNTLNLGFEANLPWRMFASTSVSYGSGFTNGMPDAQYPGNYLPQRTTFDISLGKTFSEDYTVSFTALNAANRRVLMDNSLTFGGFHYNDPREVYVQFRYRFHY